MLSDAFRTLAIEPSDAAAVLAVGWATVELERAARELGTAFDLEFVEAPGSLHLGCACRRSVATVDGVHVVLLEPSTEGRLALTLARHGEGLVAAWIRDATGRERAGPTGGAGRSARTTSAARRGPFGVERLVLGGPVSGPHHLLVERATIRMP